MQRRRVLAAMAALGAVVPARGDGDRRGVTIEISPYDSSEESAVWLSYAADLSVNAISSDAVNQAPLGPYVPTLERELAARRSMIKVWRELQAKEHKPYPYMEALTGVEDAGFLREYVWTVHWRSTWKQTPDNLRIAEFYAWQREALKGHEPRTGARVLITVAPESPASAASR